LQGDQDEAASISISCVNSISSVPIKVADPFNDHPLKSLQVGVAVCAERSVEHHKNAMTIAQ
jgi:hypothetical protein